MRSFLAKTVRTSRTCGRACLTLAALIVTIAPASAQWDLYIRPDLPRTPDGKVDMDAPPLRTSYGKPDLQGFWMPTDQVKHLLNIAADLGEDGPPLTEWGREVLDERVENNGVNHPGAYCLPSGIPEKDNIPDGLKLVQTEDLTIFLYESRTIYRQVFTDGRPLPKDPQPTWMGYSIGHWEDDTFVVETIGQNGRTWLDMRGHPGTESLRVIERFTRPSIGHMDIEVTIEDPKAYTEPWVVNMDWTLQPDFELIESICEENNRDPNHMVGK